ncbi:Os04g0116650, partial [Oryza sativa Japonica Group]
HVCVDVEGHLQLHVDPLPFVLHVQALRQLLHVPVINPFRANSVQGKRRDGDGGAGADVDDGSPAAPRHRRQHGGGHRRQRHGVHPYHRHQPLHVGLVKVERPGPRHGGVVHQHPDLHPVHRLPQPPHPLLAGAGADGRQVEHHRP